MVQVSGSTTNQAGSADRVEVSSDGADSVQFLDAVKKRNADGLMKGIGVISVEVYAGSYAKTPLRSCLTSQN